MSQSVEQFFSEQSPLADGISGFRPRLQQKEMALAVADAIRDRAILIAEAGTGTGKTFAYLVPALLNGGKVIISTGTKNLQDQLYQKDLPMVREALKVGVTTALLKGRANYVCHYHLERALGEGRFTTKTDVKYLKRIERFAKTSQTGDKGSLSDVPEQATIWAQVTSTRDNCLGQDCPEYKSCFVLKARQEAMKADIVVVNHHLFFADVMLRDEGVAELLPACNTVIFDEAHQLPETASLFFGDNLSTSQLIDLARDTRIEALISAKDFAELPKASDALDKAARDLRLVFKKEGRLPARALDDIDGFAPALSTVLDKLTALNTLLSSQAARSEGLENCWVRGQSFLNLIQQWQRSDLTDRVRWLEVFMYSVQLNTTPLSIAEIFAKQIDSTPRAWIFTSATLAVKQNFVHYQNEMGLINAQTACWDSPFDYQQQSLFYVPQGLPDPNHPDYTDRVVQAALPLLEASRGRAFMLFTSLRAMQRAYEILQAELDRRNLTYPLLMQGEGTRNDLVERFRNHGNAILLGSQSFWEGVDVRGEALSLVIIDKIPFAPPDDPVLSARLDQLKKQGVDAFMEYQLPRTIINLKQGAGRLIRDVTDRGVLMICDPRLISKQYGRRIWQSLPAMKRTRNEQEAVDFFKTEVDTE